jgi:hypothetical protein
MSDSFLRAAATRAADASVDSRTTHLLQLPDDSLACLAAVLEADDRFPCALASRRLRKACGIPAAFKTSLVSTVRSQTLRAWASEVGCPSPYPHWARLFDLKREEWNHRLVRVEGPPNDHGRQPVWVDAYIGKQRRHLLNKPTTWPGPHVLIRRENINPLRADFAARAYVLVIDSMLPRQKLRVTRAENERLFDRLSMALAHYKTTLPASLRLCMVGREPRSQHELLQPTVPPSPVPFGVEVHIAVEDSESGEPRDTITVTAGRPFELLELLRFDGGSVVEPQTNREAIMDVLSGNMDSFLARVHWLPYETYSGPRDWLKRGVCASAREKLEREGKLPGERLERALRDRFRAWGECVRRGGHERFPGQLDQILADLGPCPSIDEPDAACLWLAALLNPLPALGVAPEIRAHVLAGQDWGDRLSTIQKGFEASCQAVQYRSFRPGAVIDELAEIDICRVS